MSETLSPVDAARLAYRPRIPTVLRAAPSEVAIREGGPTDAVADAGAILDHFPRTHGRPRLEIVPGAGPAAKGPLHVGVVLSGGQAPGGHNVIAGLFDGLRQAHPESRLVGFLDGPKGVIVGNQRELEPDTIDRFRNMGGFDLIGSGRDKIEREDQLAASRETCRRLGLAGLVVIGGDDSNTNAAVLAEYFVANGDDVTVLGVPKTIDGDLKGGGVEASFGFDTATRVYASLIGNIARDAASARKYWHFIKLMGRSASHVTLECALATQVNVALIAEEVEQRGMTLDQVVDHVAGAVRRRAEAGRSYGVCLVPEGLVEFVPEMRALIQELNRMLADEASAFEAAAVSQRETFVRERLSERGRQTFAALPERIRGQLLIDRDSHGNVQVSKIDTEQLLIEKVSERIASWKAEGAFAGSFKAQGHFFGYEGRAANPSDFDADYTYALGRVAALLTAARRTGYLCAVGNLAAHPEDWRAAGIPLTSLMQIEERKGRRVPVIAKALVRTAAEPFRTFAARRERWQLEDDYRYPGSVQYFGPPEVTSLPTKTVLLEQAGSDESPQWLRRSR